MALAVAGAFVSLLLVSLRSTAEKARVTYRMSKNHDQWDRLQFVQRPVDNLLRCHSRWPLAHRPTCQKRNHRVSIKLRLLLLIGTGLLTALIMSLVSYLGNYPNGRCGE